MNLKKLETVLYTVDNNILTVTLNRPEKRNALNDIMVNDLKSVFRQHSTNDSIAAVILTGSGKAFCAGADLAYLQSLMGKSFAEHLDDSNRLKDLYFTIYDYPKPVIALVNGPAIGGGCGLVNVCDFVLACDTALFGYPEVKIGFTPAIVSVFLIYSIGYHRAKNLLLSGRILGAREARQVGLVDEVVSDSDLGQEGERYVAELRKNSPSSMKLTKNFLNKIQAQIGLETLLARSAEFNAKSRLEKDFVEGITAFLSKRTPDWYNK